MSEIIKFYARSFPFKDHLFNENTVKDVKSLIWWLALKDNISSGTLDVITKFFTTVASSAGIEHIFSTYSIVHSKLKNRLKVEKSSKLVSIFKTLNKEFVTE